MNHEGHDGDTKDTKESEEDYSLHRQGCLCHPDLCYREDREPEPEGFVPCEGREGDEGARRAGEVL